LKNTAEDHKFWEAQARCGNRKCEGDRYNSTVLDESKADGDEQ